MQVYEVTDKDVQDAIATHERLKSERGQRKEATLFFDGASKGNPGRAGSGSVLTVGPLTLVHCTPFGRTATNNEAEYVGLLEGMRMARQLGVTHLVVKGDSKLVVEQMSGRWKVNDTPARKFHAKAKAMLSDFADVSFTWIPREENGHADWASNEAVPA